MDRIAKLKMKADIGSFIHEFVSSSKDSTVPCKDLEPFIKRKKLSVNVIEGVFEEMGIHKNDNKYEGIRLNTPEERKTRKKDLLTLDEPEESIAPSSATMQTISPRRLREIKNLADGTVSNKDKDAANRLQEKDEQVKKMEEKHKKDLEALKNENHNLNVDEKNRRNDLEQRYKSLLNIKDEKLYSMESKYNVEHSKNRANEARLELVAHYMLMYKERCDELIKGEKKVRADGIHEGIEAGVTVMQSMDLPQTLIEAFRSLKILED